VRDVWRRGGGKVYRSCKTGDGDLKAAASTLQRILGLCRVVLHPAML
jgi:hypothetical protein